MSLDRLINRDAGGSQVVIPYLHNKSHNGDMFHVSGKITGILTTGVEHILISTGAEAVHLNRVRMSFGSGDVTVTLFEDVTTSADGTGLPEENLNRESATTTLTSFFTGPTITVQGSLIHTLWWTPTASGVGQSAGGTDVGFSGEEWILSPSTKYEFHVLNSSGDTIDMWYEFLYYEVPV